MRGPFRRIPLRDYFEFALSDLAQRKLRTFLTAFGVTVGIGALTAMVGFGIGMQKNVTDNFRKLDLFNSLTVLPEGSGPAIPARGRRGPAPRRSAAAKPDAARLDDAAVARIAALPGVESAYAEIRFPAVIRFEGKEEFRLVQVLPAASGAFRASSLAAGRMYGSDDQRSVVVSRGLLRQLDVSDPVSAVGKTIEIAPLSLDLSVLQPAKLGALLSRRELPFKKEYSSFTVAGVMEGGGAGGPMGLGSDVLLPPGPASGLSKLPITNLWDLFQAGEGRFGYSAINVRLSSPGAADSVRRAVRAMGFSTFALVDQFEQIKTGFVLMDMFLAAIAMIAIFVASLGIINTMVMAVMERTSEIGVMKAVGASPRDIKKIFVFESSLIGLGGGVCGIILGWAASRAINPVINYFGARQDLPAMEYFRFPLWLILGGIAFAGLVSLLSGLYPAQRAAKVDPAVALRHE
jgi:putative ABC transport system permease protein